MRHTSSSRPAGSRARQRRCLLVAALLLPIGAWLRPAKAASEPGVAVLIRHAQTEPGTGDPPGYRLEDCSSQRQLSDAGRAQARALARTLAAHGLVATEVRASRWCRCLETARLGFDQVQPWPALDSFFDEPARGPAQTAELRAALLALPRGAVAVWVTHQVNITAVSGTVPAMGEALVLRARPGRDGQPQVQTLARLPPPAAP
jgi:broad specificity phosphatase PhoE